MAIVSSKSLVNPAKEKILRRQRGEDLPFRTRYSHINELGFGGMDTKSIWTIAGSSGTGKTHVLLNIEQDFLDLKMNPQGKDYALLRCNWEMPVYKILLRKLTANLGVKMSVLLNNEPTPEMQVEIDRLYEIESSERVSYMQEPPNPDVWYTDTKKFLEDNKDKKHVLISVDHIALVKRGIYRSKKDAMDSLVEYANDLKQDFDNVTFIFISQLNRAIETRTEPRDAAPRRSDLYNTDTIYHISDFVIVLHNPYKIGLEAYMVFSVKRYGWLEKHKVVKKGGGKTTNFKTIGRIFWHYIKVREQDDPKTLKDLFIEMLYEVDEEDDINPVQASTVISRANMSEIAYDEGDMPF